MLSNDFKGYYMNSDAPLEPPPPAEPAPHSGLFLIPCPCVLCSSGKDGAARKYHPFPSPSIKSITSERSGRSRDFLLHF